MNVAALFDLLKGPLGSLAAMAVVGIGFVIWNWDRVKRIPGAMWLPRTLIRARGFRGVRHDRFSVVLLSLDGDDKNAVRRVIADHLANGGIPGGSVQVIQSAIRLSVSGATDIEIATQRAHAQARKWLARSGATVCIWGSVLEHGTSTRLRLHWTGNGWVVPERSGNRYDLVEFDLPDFLLADLVGGVLALLAATAGAEFELGEDDAQLEQLIGQVRHILASGADLGEHRSSLMVTLSRCLATIDWVRNDPAHLIEAIALAREACDWLAAHSSGEGLARAKIALARALFISGHVRWDVQQVGDAIRVYEEVAASVSQQTQALAWAAAKRAIASAELLLAERVDGTRLEAAEIAARESLTVVNVQGMPLIWAKSQALLGGILSEGGQRAGDLALLERATVAFDEAITSLSKKLHPEEWALQRSNYALHLKRVASLNEDDELLERAETILRDVLAFRTRSRPMSSAYTLNNLGMVLAQLGESTGHTDDLAQAAAAYREALSLCESRNDVVLANLIAVNLGRLLTKNASETGSQSAAAEAREVLERALAELTNANVPRYAVLARSRIASAVCQLAWATTDRPLLLRGLDLMREAGAMFDSRLEPEDLALVMMDIAYWLLRADLLTADDTALDEAWAALDRADALSQPRRGSRTWRAIHSNRAVVLARRGAHRADPGTLDDAARLFREVLSSEWVSNEPTERETLVADLESVEQSARTLRNTLTLG